MTPVQGARIAKRGETMTINGPISMVARRKSNRNRNYASTLVHYLGVDEALAVCHERMWHQVRKEILQQNSF